MASRWIIYGIINIALAALIVWGALAYAPPIPKIFQHQDKLEHFLAFGILMMWLTAMLRPKNWKLAFIGAGLASAGLEIAQSLLTSSRSGDLPDLMASLLGVLAATIFILVARNMLTKKVQRSGLQSA